MAAADWVVFAVLMVFLICAGWWAKRLSRSVAHFTVAGRSLGMWLMMSSTFAGGIGLVSIAAMAQTGFTVGFSYLWISLGVLLLISIPLFGVLGIGIMRYRATNVQTLPQYYEMRYNRGVRVFAGVVLAVGGVLNMAIFPVVESHALIALLNLPDMVQVLGVQVRTFSILLFFLLALALYFANMGGMVSVTVTDYIQSWVMWLGLGAILFFAIRSAGLERIETALIVHRGEAAFNPLLKTSLGVVFVLNVLIGSIVGRLSFPPSLQITAAIKNPRIVRLSALVSPVFNIGITLIFVAFGVVCLALYGPDVPPGVDGEIYQRGLIGKLVMDTTPAWFKGLALAGFVFASISTNDSYMLAWGSVIGNDVIRAIHNRPFTPEQHVKLLKGVIAGIAAFIFLFGLWYKPGESILQYFYITGAIFNGCGIITWFGLYWRRANAAGAWAALVLALVVPLGWMLFTQLVGVAWLQNHPPLDRWITQDNVTLAASVLPALALVAISLLRRGGEEAFVDYGEKLKDIQAREAESVVKETR